MPNNEHTQVTENDTDAAALERARARAEAIPIAEIMQVRLPISEAAFGVIASKGRLELLRPEVARELGDEGTSALDELVPAARLALLAQADHAALADTDLEDAAKALGEKRTRLVSIVNALVARRRGLKSPTLVGGQSYLGIATDVLALVRWFVGNAQKLGEFAKLSKGELSAIQSEAEAFAALVKKPDGASSTPTGLSRARAYTHFVEVHDRVRQVLTFVRWDAGDQDQFAPSLFAGRDRKAASDEPAPPEPVTPAQPNTPAVPVVTVPVVAAPTDVAPIPPPPVAPVTPAAPIDPGLPGADPFVRTT